MWLALPASTEPNRFTEDDVALLGAFAEQAATAIASARLYRQARGLALLQERDRIAKELHDGIIQAIYGVGLNLDYCTVAIDEDPGEVKARLRDASAGLNRVIQDIRGYITDLHHRVSGDLDLREAVEGLVREFAAPAAEGQGQPRVMVDVDDAAAQALPSERRVEVIQILREAIANASRHGRATDVNVTLRVSGSRLLGRIADNGVGFEPGTTGEEGHHGLRNMVDRAYRLDGHLDIHSRPGEGTQVELVVPLVAS